jgi:hypothetical protein
VYVCIYTHTHTHTLTNVLYNIEKLVGEKNKKMGPQFIPREILGTRVTGLSALVKTNLCVRNNGGKLEASLVTNNVIDIELP